MREGAAARSATALQACEAFFGDAPSRSADHLSSLCNAVRAELGRQHWLTSVLVSRLFFLLAEGAQEPGRSEGLRDAMMAALEALGAGAPPAVAVDLLHDAADPQGLSMIALSAWSQAFASQPRSPFAHYAHATALWNAAIGLRERAPGTAERFFLGALRNAARAVPLPGMSASQFGNLVDMLAHAAMRSAPQGPQLARLCVERTLGAPPESLSAHAATLAARVDLASAAVDRLGATPQVHETRARLRELRAWLGSSARSPRLPTPEAVAHDSEPRTRAQVGLPHLQAFDLDDDGNDEVIAVGRDGVGVWRVRSGSLVYLGGSRSTRAYAVAVDDVDLDGQPEILVVSDAGLEIIAVDESGAPCVGHTFEGPALRAVTTAFLGPRVAGVGFRGVVVADERGRLGSACSTELGNFGPWHWQDGVADVRRLLSLRDAEGEELVVAVASEVTTWRHDHERKAFVEVAPRRPCPSPDGEAFVERRASGGDRLWVARVDPPAALAWDWTDAGWVEARAILLTNAPSGLCVSSDGAALYVYGGDFLLYRVDLSRESAPDEHEGFPLAGGVGGAVVPVRLAGRPTTIAHASSEGELGLFDEGMISTFRKRVTLLEDPWTVVALARVPSFEGCLAMGARRDCASLSVARVPLDDQPVATPLKIPLGGVPCALHAVDLRGSGEDDVLALVTRPHGLVIVRRDVVGAFSIVQTVSVPDDATALSTLSWADGRTDVAVVCERSGRVARWPVDREGRLGSPIVHDIGGALDVVAAWPLPQGRCLLTLGSAQGDGERGVVRAFRIGDDGSAVEVSRVALPKRGRFLAVLRRSGAPWRVAVALEGHEVAILPLRDGQVGDGGLLDLGAKIEHLGSIDPACTGDDMLLALSSETQSALVLSLDDRGIVAESMLATGGHFVAAAWARVGGALQLVTLPSPLWGRPTAAMIAILHRESLDGVALVRTTLRARPGAVGAPVRFDVNLKKTPVPGPTLAAPPPNAPSRASGARSAMWVAPAVGAILLGGIAVALTRAPSAAPSAASSPAALSLTQPSAPASNETGRGAAVSTLRVSPPPPPPPRSGQTRVLRPSSMSASSVLQAGSKRFPAALAFDGSDRTAWNEGAPGPGVGEWIEAWFDHPTRVRRVWMTTGWRAISRHGADLFHGNAHLRRVHLEFDRGRSAPVDVGYEQQEVSFDGLDVVTRRVRVFVDDVHVGTHWEDLCISEVEVSGDDRP
ncbi:MAG: VCBS repeat-containing protein [Polyangiales bacterium]